METQEEIKKVVPTLDDIKELMDKNYSLRYVDYNDDLSNLLPEVQKAIHGDFEDLDEKLFDSFSDTNDAEQEILNELQTKIERKFDLEDAEEIIEEHRDELLDEIHERDDSDVLKDLLKNTGEQVMFYDLNVEIDGYGVDIKERIKQVKRGLKLKIRDTQYDKDLKTLVENASYGGRLVVYFYNTLDNYLNINEKINTISFSGNVNIAIIDNNNGSGFDISLPLELKFPFNKENLFIDKTVHYSYTFEVCGLVSNWCESTTVSLTHTKTRKKAVTSELNDHVAREKEFEETFIKGSCTFGDMNIKRHRNITYENNFPCGNRCSCGTFWID